MKAKGIYQGIALLAVALTTAACQNEINENTPTSPQYYHFKFKAGADATTTPPTLTDGEGTY